MGGVSAKSIFDYTQETECVTSEPPLGGAPLRGEHGDKGNLDYYNGRRNVLINPSYYPQYESDEGYWNYLFQWR